MTREKEKWDAKEKKLSETICHRDGCIDELKRSVTRQSEEISELVARFQCFELSLQQL